MRISLIKLVCPIEPLAMFYEVDDAEEKLKFLNETFHCKSPKYRNWVDKTLSWNQLGRHCKQDGLCNWELSLRLCREPFCDSKNGFKPKYCRKHCPNFELEERHHLIEDICKNQVNAVAMKTIRILSLSQIEPLFSGNFDMNLKVVVLVRDPRSIFHSRKKIAMKTHKEVTHLP